MNVAFCGSRISDHLARTPEGFLLCLSVPICRTGEQKYRAHELGLSGGDEIRVIRPASEVLSAATIASFEGKPICDDHPPRFLDPSNASSFQKGHLQHVRPGPPLPDGELPLLADLVVTDAALIDKILHGKREVSGGYNTEYFANDDGTVTQTQIRGNHVAVVTTGRAGENIAIQDAIQEEKMTSQDVCERLDRLIELLTHQQAGQRTIVRDTARNAPAATFYEHFAQVNSAYGEFTSERNDGQAFADEANAMGRKMRTEDCRPSIVHRPSDEGAEDWAATINRRGRELRK